MSAPLQAPQQGHVRREFVKYCCRFRAEWATNMGYNPCLSFYATYNLMPVTRAQCILRVCLTVAHSWAVSHSALAASVIDSECSAQRCRKRANDSSSAPVARLLRLVRKCDYQSDATAC